MKVEHGDRRMKWKLTRVYGKPKTSRRRKTWDLLRELAAMQMVNFREALEQCRLEDLGFTGNWFTWERGNVVENNVRERLDGVVASRGWREIFSNFLVKHATRFALDHCAIVIDTEECKERTIQKVKRKFRFKAMWSKEEDCVDIIKEAWGNNDDSSMEENMQKIGTKLS